MTEYKLPPGSIGWFYRVLGVMLLVSSVLLVGLKLYLAHELNTFDVVIFTLLFFASLGLIRPALFDQMSKLIADRLPFFKYSKESDSGKTDMEVGGSDETGAGVRKGSDEAD